MTFQLNLLSSIALAWLLCLTARPGAAFPFTSERMATPLACGGECRFVLCRGPQLAVFAKVGAKASQPICRNGSEVRVFSTGEAMVMRDAATPVSRLATGSGRNLPKNTFRSAVRRNSSVIIARPVVGALTARCVKLPVQSWALRSEMRNVQAGGAAGDCIAFRSRVVEVQVELMWNSNDDLDLFVTEPDGGMVSFARPRSDAGRLLKDRNAVACGTRKRSGLERIVYRGQMLMDGTYNVFAEHTTNCEEGPTNWKLRVTVMGKLVSRRSGRSNTSQNFVVKGSELSFIVSK